MLNPKFVDFEVAIAIHDDLIQTYGGSLGLRDRGLLESALSQPKATFFDEFLHSTIPQQAAAYLYHIAKNHAFVDGNKRTAVAIMEVFIRMNNYNLSLSDDELYDLALKVSTNQLEKSDIANILKSHLMTLQFDKELEDS